MTVGALSLALNLALTGVFIAMVIRLLKKSHNAANEPVPGVTLDSIVFQTARRVASAQTASPLRRQSSAR